MQEGLARSFQAARASERGHYPSGRQVHGPLRCVIRNGGVRPFGPAYPSVFVRVHPRRKFGPSAISVQERHREVLQFRRCISVGVSHQGRLLRGGFRVATIVSRGVVFFGGHPYLYVIFFANRGVGQGPRTYLVFCLRRVFCRLFGGVRYFHRSSVGRTFYLIGSRPNALSSHRGGHASFSFPRYFRSHFPVRVFLLSSFKGFNHLR